MKNREIFNSDKTILDLCGGTGSWSRPYSDVGYDVRVITWPDDVRLWPSLPEKKPVAPTEGSKFWLCRNIPKGMDRQEWRSITPPGFAKAFFEANP